MPRAALPRRQLRGVGGLLGLAARGWEWGCWAAGMFVCDPFLLCARATSISQDAGGVVAQKRLSLRESGRVVLSCARQTSIGQEGITLRRDAPEWRTRPRGHRTPH